MTNKQEKMICNTFGISKLRSFQKKAITDLSDGKDVLGLAQTSEGKSICFLSMITLHPNGLLIGILPTVALMRDLVQRCEDSKIRGNRKNTTVIERLTHRKLQAIFVAPERLSDPHLWKAIQKNSVHTVVVAAFSATVMPDDISYIAKSLRMKNPVVHIGKLKRSNLSLKKAFVKNDVARYAKVSKTIQKCGSKGKVVIYCTRVCDVEDMRDFLIEDCDISASAIALCHSRLSNRAEQEARFRSGEAHIMIATSTFGMGVNVPDIRLIIVSQLPFSVASFYQMAGRAGRDGKRAKALLLWNDADFQMNLDIISDTDYRAVDAVNELYAICESSDDLHDAVIGCFAKGGV